MSNPPAPSWLARLDSYLELVRLPNLFTAMADVAMGLLFVRPIAGPEDWRLMGLLMAASALLYAAGVVLNDVFDFDIDLRQRPERPLPSGRVSRGTARHLGWQLLLAGLLPGWILVFVHGTFWPGMIALTLAAVIVLYDALLKRTPLGPPAMGACRMLNVLLGMSVATAAWQAPHWLVAGGIGVYVTGLTWFARDEAGQPRQGQLVAALAVMLLGVAMLAGMSRWADGLSPLLQRQPLRWPVLMLVLGALIAWQCMRAIRQPGPGRIQIAVRQCILSLVILDASVVFAVRGTQWAAIVLLLLVPTVVLGRRFAST